MEKWFRYDGSVFSFLGTVADLALLNLLTIIFSLPLFTIGASITAGHYVALKIRRNEGTIIKSFWRSFKMNLKQATLIELYILIFAALLLVTVFCVDGGDMTSGSFVHIFVLIFSVYAMFTLIWVFPLQARFVNPVHKAIRLAFGLSAKHIFRTLYMLVLYLLPITLVALNIKFLSVVVVFGISGPIYGSAILYNKVFAEMEEEIEKAEESEPRKRDENRNE